MLQTHLYHCQKRLWIALCFRISAWLCCIRSDSSYKILLNYTAIKVLPKQTNKCVFFIAKRKCCCNNDVVAMQRNPGGTEVHQVSLLSFRQQQVRGDVKMSANELFWREVFYIGFLSISTVEWSYTLCAGWKDVWRQNIHAASTVMIQYSLWCWYRKGASRFLRQ